MFRKAISLILWIAVGASCLPGSSFAGGMVYERFDQHGYDPRKLYEAGAHSCDPSSNERLLAQFVSDSRNVSGAFKRQELVYDAIGFAKYFTRKRDLKRVEQQLGMSSGDACNPMRSGDCTNTAKLIRELSHLQPGQDWCAAFVADLSQLVDEQAGGGPPNVLHSSPKSDDASNYASVAKLLAIFDPKVSRKTIAGWKGGMPRKRTSNFIQPGMRPVPGCVALYKDVTAPPNHQEGHVALVVHVSSDGKMNTVEGNTAPEAGSLERGVYAKFQARPWGDGSYYQYNNEKMVYQGCIMPWSQDSVVLGNSVCTEAISDSRLKPLDPVQTFLGTRELGGLDIPTMAGVPR